VNVALQKTMDLLLDIREKAKTGKDFKLSDEIRAKLTEAGIQIKDTKEGSLWKI
jgi:cysteinyl-tRNA synthetase